MIGRSEAIVIIALTLAVMIGLSIILLIIGLTKRKSRPETAKHLFILAGLYLLISGGICGSLHYN